MMEIILYFILLFIYVKLPFLDNIRSIMGFRENVLLTLVSIAIFAYSCTQIILDKSYVFDILIENYNLRVSFLLIYIVSFVTLFGFSLSHYYYKNAKKKIAPIGEKGLRGNRGKLGKHKKCLPIECQKNICSKRMVSFISTVYRNYLKASGNSTHANAQINNTFILNKIKLLCKSTQLSSMIRNKGADKSYLYIQDTWKKWIHIILKYEKGIEFLENEYLNDNDFDNLITVSDKVYADFNNIKEPGTPSKGLESPFDEIKKFDMWYWGSPLKAMPKIVYKCDVNNTNTLKQLESNRYQIMWRSSIARQALVNKGSLKNDTCIQQMKYAPFQQKGNEKITIYRPETVELKNETYKPLGDVVIKGDIHEHYKTTHDEMTPRDNLLPEKLKKKGSPKETTLLVSGDIKEPIGFTKKYTSVREKGIGVGIKGYSFWEPIAPEGYVCIGDVVDNTPNLTPPEPSTIACVPKMCVRKNKRKDQQIWNSKDDHECISDCGCDMELKDDGTRIDTDEKTSQSDFNLYDDKTHLFKIDNTKLYELIPSGEKGDNGEPSCFDAEALKLKDNSKWKVHPKNDKKYSIFNIYDLPNKGDSV